MHTRIHSSYAPGDARRAAGGSTPFGGFRGVVRAFATACVPVADPDMQDQQDRGAGSGESARDA
jgi:hypothetical protein